MDQALNHGVLVTPSDVFCKLRGEVLKLSECVQRAEGDSRCFSCVLQMMLLRGRPDDCQNR